MARLLDPVRAWAAIDACPTAVLAAASRELARARGLPVERVGRFASAPETERTSGLPPLRDPLDLGRLHEAQMVDARGRKSAGAFYTPEELAGELARVTLFPLLERTRGEALPRIADPSCGAGSFLVQAVRLLRSAMPAADAAQIVACVHGADLDPVAVALCADSVWIELGNPDLDPDRVLAQLRCGDALVDTALPGAPDGWRPVDWAEIAPDGFDAILGNPPWDRDEPDPRAFFSSFDPGYPKLVGAEAARARTRILDAHPGAAAQWGETLRFLDARQAALRERFPGSASATKTNAYQRFLALGLERLAERGRIGFLVPAGFYADRGSAGLRDELFGEHHVERLVGFDNRGRLFPGVDRRFKFAALVADRGRRDAPTQFGFLRTRAADMATGTLLDTDRVRRLSPSSGAVLEIDDPRDLDLLTRLTERARLGGTDWAIRFRREIDLTLDRSLFVPAEARRADDLPVWEGRMIDAFCATAKRWVSGTGRRARWTTPSDLRAMPGPQFHVRADALDAIDPDHAAPKIGFMAVGSATNARTMAATLLWRAPCGNSVPTLRCRSKDDGTPGESALCAILNSSVFDWALRLRMAGNNLNRFVLIDVAVPPPGSVFGIEGLDAAVEALALTSAWFDPLRARSAQGSPIPSPLLDGDARRRVRAALDAVIAQAYGLGIDEYAHVLAGTDLPSARLTPAAVARHPLPAKGFWRIDRELPPTERLPALALAAFRRLDAGVPPAELLAATSQRTTVRG